MNKLKKTAKTLDVVFNILEIVAMIAFVSCLVGVGIIVIGTLIGLPDNQIGTDFNKFEIGNLSFFVTEEYAPSVDTVLLFTGIVMSLAAILSYIAKRFIKLIRVILHTVTEGLPFDNSVSANLKKASLLIIVMGIGMNLVSIVEHIFAAYVYDLPEIILSGKITSVSLNCNIDLSFLISAAVIYLISYVCKYGATLQEQVDETL